MGLLSICCAVEHNYRPARWSNIRADAVACEPVLKLLMTLSVIWGGGAVCSTSLKGEENYMFSGVRNYVKLLMTLSVICGAVSSTSLEGEKKLYVQWRANSCPIVSDIGCVLLGRVQHFKQKVQWHADLF